MKMIKMLYIAAFFLGATVRLAGSVGLALALYVAWQTFTHWLVLAMFIFASIEVLHIWYQFACGLNKGYDKVIAQNGDSDLH